MKEMRRGELEKSIKKALEEGRDWCRLDIGHCYRLMINTDDATIWADLLDVNHWRNYQDDSITSLYSIDGTIEEMETDYLKDAITKLTDAGWIIK